MAAAAALTLGPNNQFDVARQKAQQQEASTLQTQKDALARRAAALGGGPSGAFVKQEALANDASARRLGDTNETINAAQQQEERRLGEVAQQQQYATSEREASQKFASGESAMQRKIAQQGLDLQKYGIDTNKSFQQQGLDLQKYGIDTNKGFQEAGLTGTYKGVPTLAGQTYADAKSQNTFENKVNVSTLLGTTIGNLKTQGYKDDQIQGIVGSLFGGINLGALGVDLGGLMNTFSSPAAAAPPVAVPTPAQTKNKWDPSDASANKY